MGKRGYAWKPATDNVPCPCDRCHKYHNCRMTWDMDKSYAEYAKDGCTVFIDYVESVDNFRAKGGILDPNGLFW